jgi:hypothetical protein
MLDRLSSLSTCTSVIEVVVMDIERMLKPPLQVEVSAWPNLDDEVCNHTHQATIVSTQVDCVVATQ